MAWEGHDEDRQNGRMDDEEVLVASYVGVMRDDNPINVQGRADENHAMVDGIDDDHDVRPESPHPHPDHPPPLPQYGHPRHPLLDLSLLVVHARVDDGVV